MTRFLVIFISSVILATFLLLLRNVSLRLTDYFGSMTIPLVLVGMTASMMSAALYYLGKREPRKTTYIQSFLVCTAVSILTTTISTSFGILILKDGIFINDYFKTIVASVLIILGMLVVGSIVSIFFRKDYNEDKLIDSEKS
jgi:hypothetical protein